MYDISISSPLFIIEDEGFFYDFEESESGYVNESDSHVAITDIELVDIPDLMSHYSRILTTVQYPELVS